MTSRAAILPYPGDPFLLRYWLKLFNTVWGNEVDTLYIYLNSPIEAPVVDYIRSLCASNPKINLQYNNIQIEHGDAINRTLDIVKEEYVMLVEDDGFIFKPGIVDSCFKCLESGVYDIVGSKRGSCAMEILTAAQRKWGLSYEGEGDQGCNFWPCYFFSKKQTLIDTDRNFAARAWRKGEVIPGLDYQIMDEVSCGDTFVNTSLQLRSKYSPERILCVPQYHGSPEDLQHAAQGRYLFDGMAKWTHVGSLSSGVGGILQDGHGRALARRLIDEDKGENTPLPNYCNSEGEKHEWERRVQWWLTFVQAAESDKISEFRILYDQAVNRLIEQYGLSRDNIRNRQKVYSLQLGL